MWLWELWSASGLCVGCIFLYVAWGVVGCKWVVYGLHIVICSLGSCGMQVGCVWVVYGLHIAVCSLGSCGLQVGCVWAMYGLHISACGCGVHDC